MKKSIISILIISFILVACVEKSEVQKNLRYTFGMVTRGSIEQIVSSSGSLEPVSTVNVLAQMSGIVEKVNTDFNDTVRKGQVLVVLNTDMLKLQKKEKLASLSKAQANYELQLLNYQNLQKLASKDLISEYELKSAKTTLDVYAAEVSGAEATYQVIEKEINDYAFIKSPIDGIVLQRNINVGESVVEGSSSNASSIFTLAGDLTHMQIEATVDELDIASIKKGQSVRFTVEAMSKRHFSGKVQKIYLLPETTDSVVSYYVIISVDNADGTLLPGMTAEVEFIASKSTNVLMVPNSALRYEPSSLSSEEIAEKLFYAGLDGLDESNRAVAVENRNKALKEATAEKSEKSAGKTGLSALVMPGSIPGRPMGHSEQSNKKNTASLEEESSFDNGISTLTHIWFRNEKGELDVMQVKAGITDGIHTEIITEKNLENMQIILKEAF